MMTVPAVINDVGRNDFPALDFINLEILGFSKMLENVSSFFFISDSYFHKILFALQFRVLRAVLLAPCCLAKNLLYDCRKLF